MAGGQSWTTSETLAPVPPGYDLRPLSTGEILDRTFQLYRSRFALFASLAALPAAVRFLTGVLQLVLLPKQQVLRSGQHVLVSRWPWVSVGVGTVFVLVYFVFYGITQAATTWAVAEMYLGKTASARAAWQAVLVRWLRYVLVTLRQYWSIGWWPLLSIAIFSVALILVPGRGRPAGIFFGVVAFFLVLQIIASMIYAVWAAIRVSLGVPASVIESLNANAAVRRSIALLPERKGRIFLLGLLIYAMSIVVGMVLLPLAFLALAAQGVEHSVLQIVQLLGSFFGSMLIGPVAAIGLCLFYFDERVRHEGFDIEFLMLRAGGMHESRVAEDIQSPEPA